MKMIVKLFCFTGLVSGLFCSAVFAQSEGTARLEATISDITTKSVNGCLGHEARRHVYQDSVEIR